MAPHKAIDSVLVASEIVSSLQSIVARNVDPMTNAVVSICTFHAGDAFNVIPASATLTGTVRTLDPAVHDEVARRVVEVAEGIALAYGASASVNYERQYPITFNHARQAAFAADVAREIVGSEHVDDNVMAIMGSEDFSFMLNACPGAFVFLGTGDGEMCHHPGYKFDDAVIPHGSSFWVKLIEKAMPVG